MLVYLHYHTCVYLGDRQEFDPVNAQIHLVELLVQVRDQRRVLDSFEINDLHISRLTCFLFIIDTLKLVDVFLR